MVNKLCPTCRLKRYGFSGVYYYSCYNLRQSHQRRNNLNQLSCTCDDQHDRYQQRKLGNDEELQCELHVKLRQYIGYEIEVELENFETVHGKVIYVGKNFVELIVKDHMTDPNYDDKDGIEELESADDGEESSEEQDRCSECKEHQSDKKYYSYIFLIDKIERIKIYR